MAPGLEKSKLRERARRAAYDLRRVRQTPGTFANWPEVLWHVSAGRALPGDESLSFRLRSGVSMVVPNVRGARLPVYEQFAEDCYDLGWLLQGLDDTIQVLDIGAHVGSFTINVASRNPSVLVDCYEPSPTTAHYLRGNVGRNALSGRVRVHEAAVADTAGTAVLEDNAAASAHNGLVQDGERLVEHGEEEQAKAVGVAVRTVTFDDAVAATREPVRVVKMDCEGGEYAFVRASSPESWKSVERVVLEYHPVAGETWEWLRGHLDDLGLVVVRDEPIAPGLGTAWLHRPVRRG